MTSARFRGGLIALVAVQASWLAICAGLAFQHRSDVVAWLFVAAGLIVAVATVAGWLRPASEAPLPVACLTYSLVILTGLISAGVQIYHLLAGHPGRHGAALGRELLIVFLTLIAMFTVIGILAELEERQGTVRRHAETVDRFAGTRWFGAGEQPPELLLAPLEIPGVYAYELSGDGFQYAVVGAERVVLVCLAPPDDPEELAAKAVTWQDRLRAADSGARVRCVLVVSPEEDPGPPPGRLLALGVTPTTAEGLLDTVAPWLGEPDHVNVPIAALLMPAKI
jgi:hypothetical protein